MKILTLKEAEKHKKILFAMGENEYSPTIVRDRRYYLWMIRRMYDSGMVIGINDKSK